MISRRFAETLGESERLLAQNDQVSRKQSWNLNECLLIPDQVLSVQGLSGLPCV